MDQCSRSNVRTEEELIKKHALEKKRLSKILKDEMKTRCMMFKESLRISPEPLTPEQEREKIREVHRDVSLFLSISFLFFCQYFIFKLKSRCDLALLLL